MGKGAETRERIVERAIRLASRDGLDGVTIGRLADELGISKSGLFAHFGSKEEMQLAVLEAAVARFQELVVKPALAAPRGEPRLRAIFHRWLGWANDPALPGGCIFLAAATELDDKPGVLRDFLVASQKEWLGAVSRATRIAIEEGHLRRDLDPEQLTFELFGVMLSYHHARRLLRDPKADARARNALDRMLAASAPTR
jgi:AcrR family transcriptional regulator